MLEYGKKTFIDLELVIETILTKKMQIAIQNDLDIIKINKVESTHIEIHDVKVSKPFFVGVDHAITPWPVSHGVIDQDAIGKLPLAGYELLLLGTGDRFSRLDTESMRYLSDTVGFEVMTTVSACRTFNIVAGEGRKVLLAAIFSTSEK